MNEVIRQLAEANAKAGEGHADGSPSMNHAEGNSADMYGLAADNSGESEGERLAREVDAAGEESQD